MTPALLALSRTFGALPGAPVHAPGDDGWYFRTPDGHAIRRAADGLLWLSDPDQPGTTAPPTARYVLDLTDAATGGVLWDRFRAVAHRFIAAGSDGYVLREMYGEDGDTAVTLAEAVARAAVALGRAG